MTQIKNDDLKKSMSGLFSRTTAEAPIQKEAELTPEQVAKTLSPEAQQAVTEAQRRQRLLGGRPKKGTEKRESDYEQMTFYVRKSQHEWLNMMHDTKGYFVKELMERAINLLMAEEEGKQ